MRRYEVRSTIMTSNRPLEDWGKLIGDVPAATAILDRFLHQAEIIKITGKRYRLRNQTKAGAEEGGTEDGKAKPAKAPSGSEGETKSSKPAKAPPGRRLRKGGENRPKAPSGSSAERMPPKPQRKEG